MVRTRRGENRSTTRAGIVSTSTDANTYLRATKVGGVIRPVRPGLIHAMPRRLHIAQLVSGRGINGAVRHSMMLAGELADRGHRVTLVHRPQLDVIFDPRFERVITDFPMTLRGFRAFAHELLARGVDVTHSHMSAAHSHGAMTRLISGLPTVATAHASHIQLHWAMHDHIVAPSSRTAAFHRRYNLVLKERISVIPNFLSLEGRSAVTLDSRARARAALGLPSAAIVLGSVGGINFKKRQSDLIKAVSQMRTPSHLVIVGEVGKDSERARFERARPLLGDRLHCLGFREDVDQILPAFDAFVMASRAEEMPIAVMEAMAAGLPVVGTDVGGMNDLVLHGETGFLSASADPTALAGLLDQMAQSAQLRWRMGSQGRTRIGQMFGSQNIMDRIEAVLAEAARQGGRPLGASQRRSMIDRAGGRVPSDQR
jgi:glycosyltransferase involved in cell wall biosynthesis